MSHLYTRNMLWINQQHLIYPAGVPRKLYTIGFPPTGRLMQVFVQENPIADGNVPAMTRYTVRLYDRNWAVNAQVAVTSSFPLNNAATFAVSRNSGLPNIANQVFYGDLYWVMGGLAANPAYPTYGASGYLFTGSGQGFGSGGLYSGAPFGNPNPSIYGKYGWDNATNASIYGSGVAFGDEMFGMTPAISSAYQGQIGGLINCQFTVGANTNVITMTAMGTPAITGQLAPAGWLSNMPPPTTGGIASAPPRASVPGQMTISTPVSTYSIFNPGSMYISFLPSIPLEDSSALPFGILDETFTPTDAVNRLGNGNGYTPATFVALGGVPYQNREGSFSTPKRQIYLEIDTTSYILGGVQTLTNTTPGSNATLDVVLTCEPQGFSA